MNTKTNNNEVEDCRPSTCSTPKRGRYVTYVFDSEYDEHKTDEKSVNFRNMLGEDYNNATPVTWAYGDKMETLEDVLQILRDIREGDIDEPQSYCKKWFDEGNGKNECYW